MALPADIFVHINTRQKPIKYTAATWMRAKWRAPKGTYRDGAAFPMGKATIKPSGGATLGEATDVPVISTEDVGATFLNAANAMRVPVSDEALNIPPRQAWEIVAGYVVAIEDATLPPLPQLPHTSEAYGRLLPVAVSITINTTTDVCSAVGHGFVTGDRIYFTGNTMPATGSGGTSPLILIYEVVRIDDDRFTVYSLGIKVNFTTAGSTVEACMFQPAPRILPPRRYAVTVDTGAESFRSSVGSATILNWVTTGDLVQFSGTTLPTGITAGTVYEAINAPVTDTDEFQVINRTTGAVVALSGSPSGVFVSLVEPYDRNVYEYLDLDGVPGLITFEDSLQPAISNVE